MVVTTVGGSGKLGYKQSWDKNCYINKLVEEAFNSLDERFITYPFDIHGSDERQFSSQAFRINMITISKDKYYEYPEYHTSLDNLKLVNGKNIYKTLTLYLKLVELLKMRVVYKNNFPECEVMLSKYNLYPVQGGKLNPSLENTKYLDITLWLLFLSDGNMSVDEVADKLAVRKSLIEDRYKDLEKKALSGAPLVFETVKASLI